MEHQLPRQPLVEVGDYKFPNGTIGKIVSYNMEERQRVKIVDYTGSKKVEIVEVDEKLKEANAQIRLDTFIDPASSAKSKASSATCSARRGSSSPT